jgi:hypothetical protein
MKRKPQASLAEAIVCDDSQDQVSTDRSETPVSTSSSTFTEESQAAVSPVNSVVPDADDEELEEDPSKESGEPSLPAADPALFYEEAAAVVHHPGEDDRSSIVEFVDEPWFYLHQKLVVRGGGPQAHVQPSMNYAAMYDGMLV